MPVRSFDNANAFHRAMRGVAGTKAGRVFFRPTAHRLDWLVSKLTAGKYSFAGIAAGLPTVILTTIGAKSGKPRTVALLGIPHSDGVAVVAANYGDARHPGWYHNLKANPVARVTIEGDIWDAIARLATPGERDEIWAKGVELYPSHQGAGVGRRPANRGLRPQAALRRSTWRPTHLATRAVADAFGSSSPLVDLPADALQRFRAAVATTG